MDHNQSQFANFTSDDMENTTILDYSGYYDLELSAAPCETEDIKAFSKVFLPTLYSLVFVVGLLGNGLVVCVLLYFRRKCNLTDICLLNLALSDLLFVLSLPFWAYYAALGHWPWNASMCRLATCLYTLGFYASIGFMVVMTLDRYLLIVHSPSITMWRTLRLGMVLISVVWVLSLVASLPNIIFVDINSTGRVTTCELKIPIGSIWHSLEYIEMNTLGLVVPLTIMVFCYSRIIPTLVNMKSQRKHKAIRLIFVILIAFFLFWTPYHVVIFLHMLKQQGYFQDCQQMSRLEMAMKWTETIGFCHCCLNPIIYAFAGEKFCRLVVKMMRQWLPLCSSSRESSERRSSIYSRSSDITTTKLI